MNDLSDELIEFLNYVEHSNDNTARDSNGTLVKHIHKKVLNIKNDASVEVEFMTLLERDREKLEEGIQKAKLEDAENLLKLGVSEDIIIKATGLSIEQIDEIKKSFRN